MENNTLFCALITFLFPHMPDWELQRPTTANSLALKVQIDMNNKRKLFSLLPKQQERDGQAEI
jgi:hypothetical protein